MYPSASFSLSLLSFSSSSSSEDDEQLITRKQEKAVFAQPSFTHYQTPNRTQARSFMFPSFTTSRSSLITLFPTGSMSMDSSQQFDTRTSFIGRDLSENFDLLSFLPPEISVEILLYLHPQDICNASAVCSRWYQLTQYSILNKKRKHYIQHKRKEYKKSKENYHGRSPSHHNSSGHMTVAPAPLNVIQPTDYNQHCPQAISPISPNTSRSHTPSPTFLVDDVNRLSLEDHQEIMIRRCLFLDFPSSPVVDSGKTFQSLRKEVAGRKLNKNRLRRL